MNDVFWLGSFGFLGGSRTGTDPDVDAYANRSGMESAKVDQLSDLVTYLKQQGFWSNVKHLYITIKGFNADTGATIYDVMSSGTENLTQTGCTWPTEEGQALSVPAAGNIISTNAIIPTSGSNTVIIGLRYSKFTTTTTGVLWLQWTGSGNWYGLAYVYNADPTLQNYWANGGDGTLRWLNNSYRVNMWSQPFMDQAYWKQHPIAVVWNASSGKIFAYMNRDSCSAIASGLGNNDGETVASPNIPNGQFQFSESDRFDFDLEFLLIMNTAITGSQYQNITYQIERAFAPRNPIKIYPGLLQFDTGGNDLVSSSTSIFYDSVTDKYYRYATNGSTYNGTPPNETTKGNEGVYCYSAPNMVGPWTNEGLVYETNNATLLAALSDVAANCWVFTPSVIYHTTRTKYVLGMKAGSTATVVFVLAESNNPDGPFTTTYAGLDSVVALNDCCLFRDADGTAYVVFHTGSKLQICALNANYTAPTGSPADITASNYEAPGMVKIGSRYWVIASNTAAWTPTDHKAFYSDAATPMSGWNDIGNPFDSGDEAYTQSFHSQSLGGMFLSRGGDLIYSGSRNIPMWYAPFDLRGAATRHIMLPIAIAGETMTISWNPNWDSSGYE